MSEYDGVAVVIYLDDSDSLSEIEDPLPCKKRLEKSLPVRTGLQHASLMYESLRDDIVDSSQESELRNSVVTAKSHPTQTSLLKKMSKHLRPKETTVAKEPIQMIEIEDDEPPSSLVSTQNAEMISAINDSANDIEIAGVRFVPQITDDTNHSPSKPATQQSIIQKVSVPPKSPHRIATLEMRNDPKESDRAKWANIKTSPLRNHLSTWSSQAKTNRTLSFNEFAASGNRFITSYSEQNQTLSIISQTDASGISYEQVTAPTMKSPQNTFLESQASHATILTKEFVVLESSHTTSIVPVLVNLNDKRNNSSSDHMMVPTPEEDREINYTPPMNGIVKEIVIEDQAPARKALSDQNSAEDEQPRQLEPQSPGNTSEKKRRRLVIHDHSEEDDDILLIDKSEDLSRSFVDRRLYDRTRVDILSSFNESKETSTIQHQKKKDNPSRLRRLKPRSSHELDDFLVFDDETRDIDDQLSELEDISSWENPTVLDEAQQEKANLSGDDLHIDLTDAVEILEDGISPEPKASDSRRPHVKWKLRESPAKILKHVDHKTEKSFKKSRSLDESPETEDEHDHDYSAENGDNSVDADYDIEALISERRHKRSRRRLTEDEFFVKDDEIVYDDASDECSQDTSESQEGDSPSRYESMCSQRHRLASIPMENNGFQRLMFTSYQAFEIVIQYLASCLVSTDFFLSLEDDEGSKSYFFSALRKLHNEIFVRKDSLLSSQAWGHEYREDIKSLSIFSYSETVSADDCMACGRSNHRASYLVKLGGISYDSDATWTLDWNPRKVLNTPTKGPPSVYEVGRFCMNRSFAFHRFQHYKLHLTQAVKEYLDGTIGEDADRIQQLISDEPWIQQKWDEYQTMVDSSETYKKS